ncbi:MAG: acetylesterase [Phycisphaera sp.]|nr:acetylesterase [Phycisphaera sp.]
MRFTNRCVSVCLLVALSLTGAWPGPAGAAPKKPVIPDFTQGDAIPEDAQHDWNLGATGARGWMYSERLTTIDARQIRITKVDRGSPADGVLAVGDVILGVGGWAFTQDPRTEFGKALTEAEKTENGGKLSLIRWRAGKTETVVVKLPTLGTYSATAPFDCPKSKRIFEEGCRTLASRVADPKYRAGPIERSLNALALLASRNPEYMPLIKKEAAWAAEFTTNGYKTWHYGYVITFLAEYAMATGDDSVLPGLRRLAMESAEGQSIVGSWGHRFANEDGRLGGYGMMNSPGVPLTIGLILSRNAGVKDPVIDLAIERSERLLHFYIGKGCIPYGDHDPWMQTHEDNGKCGMVAVMFNLLNNAEGASFFTRMCVASHSAERDCGHTGNFFNMTWAMPGVALSGPNATGAWMKEFGSWYFDLSRRPDGSFVHLGPPETRNDKYANWDCTGAFLLAYAMPLKSLYLTGKRPAIVPQIDTATAESLISDGRGWNNKDRNSAYDAMKEQELIDRLSSWSPIVRERAAMAIGRMDTPPVSTLIGMLDAPRIETRYGACSALEQLKAKAADAVPALRKTLKHEDLWLRIKAAEALGGIGQPAMVAVPDLLTMLAAEPSKSDPRAMEQRYLSFVVFGQMLQRSLDGVDRDQLRDAVRAGLRNQDGRARGAYASVYKNLSYDEIKPLLPAIYEAIVTPAPSGVMFANNIRLSGLELFAKHHIREGMPLCLSILDIDEWGKQDRIKRGLKALEQYGPAAKEMLPQLHQLEKALLAHREAKNLKPEIEQTQKTIKKIESATGTIELRSLKS